jgi:hypothetical protein
VLPPENRASNVVLELDLPIAIAGRESISINTPAGAPAFPRPSRKDDSAANPRGEIWELGPLDKVIEDPVVYHVEVTYGTAPNDLTRDFDLRIEPVVHLTAVGGGAFEASEAAPLELQITGGSAPYRLEAPNLPDDTTAVITGGTRIEVTVTPPPADPDAPAEPRDPVEVVLEVTDDDGEKGERTITVL